jgi:hypothetical protein
MKSRPSARQQSAADRKGRTTRPRYVLVRQGEGPNRKWVWQLAASPATVSGREASVRQ